jgi:hypothetical protein
VKTALEVLRIPCSTFREHVKEARRLFGFGVVGNLKRVWLHRQPVRLYCYEFVLNLLVDDSFGRFPIRPKQSKLSL